jgi:hypothetical protein
MNSNEDGNFYEEDILQYGRDKKRFHQDEQVSRQ